MKILNKVRKLGSAQQVIEETVDNYSVWVQQIAYSIENLHLCLAESLDIFALSTSYVGYNNTGYRL